MAKFPEADARLFHNKFVCKRCKTTIRAPIMQILAGKVQCRSCKTRAFRPRRKK